jgi:glycosyltransferase involved in cell wall biosynthesis
MKIAQVSPLFESVPPKTYGGTERIVSYLTEELVRMGHEVTLFASGDSVTSAKLVPVCPESVRLGTHGQAWLAYQAIQMDLVSEMADTFDVIHFHTDYLHFPIARLQHTAYVTTAHGRLDLPELLWLYRRFPDAPMVSISDSQRTPLPWLNWADTVHHGLPADLYSYGAGEGGYFLFLGRVSPEKGLDRAISIAKECDTPLYVAAKVDAADQAYFNEVLTPMLSDRRVTYIGEVNDNQKRDLLQGARALLFPIDWPEPFGLVMIEALACGTPVVAYRCGSTPEVMEHGTTGFLVDSQEAAIAAAKNVDRIDRKLCRKVFEQRFTAAEMAKRYLHVYANVLSQHHGQACELAGTYDAYPARVAVN